jgi:glycosyltransferase involved in cell wall biosynthesis
VLDQFSEAGGAQCVLMELLETFRSRGWKALVALPGDGSLLAGVRALGYPTDTLPCGPFASGAKSPLDVARFAGQLPLLARRIGSCARSFAPDVVYINGPRLLPAAALAGLQAPVVFHSHSLLPPGPVRVLCGVALRSLKASVMAVCRSVAAQWKPFLPEGSVDVVYNGVDGPSDATRRNTGPPGIGCIGRIAPEKGQLAFVEAARFILRSVPDSRFHIVGAPLFQDKGAMRYEAQVRAAAAGLPIEFHGWTSDVYSVLADLDLVLVPSACHEATTRVVLEAWAAGVPVVAFRSGGIPEILHHGHNGFLAESAEEMAAFAVHLLTAGRDQLTRVGKAGRETWRHGFTRELAQRHLLDLLTRRTFASPATIARRNRPGEARP